MANRLTSHLTQLRDFILQKNTYFDNGFAFAFQDVTEGYIFESDKVIFPADDLGNYFYLRLPDALKFDYSKEYQASDCYNGVGIVFDIVLVACVRNAEYDILVDNLINTLFSYKNQVLKQTKVILAQDEVILQELRKVKTKEDIEAALQRIPDDMTFCSIHLTFTISYVTQGTGCIVNPCLPCS